MRVIPHFVEERRLPLVPRRGARAALGVEGRRIVTLLGFIYGRKGHKVAVEAVPRLPPEDARRVRWRSGGGARQGLSDGAGRAPAELGMDDRLRITGYLSEEDLETWIAATRPCHPALPRPLGVRLAVHAGSRRASRCWSATCRASASTTQLVPGALRIFGPSAPDVLAEAIGAALATDLPEVDPRVVALREQLSVAQTVERYLAVDREAAATA